MLSRSVVEFHLISDEMRSSYVPGALNAYSRKASGVDAVDRSEPYADVAPVGVHVLVVWNVHVLLAMTVDLSGAISSSTGTAVNESVSVVWKYGFRNGKMFTIHWNCGRTTGTLMLPVTLFAARCSAH